MTTSSAVGRLELVQVDCADPVRLAQFWAATLGVGVRGELGEGPQYVFLEGTVKGGARLCFQRVREPKTTKNRLHFDLHVEEADAAVDRLLSLGATRVPDGERAEFGIRWLVLADPEGNEFCVVEAGD